METHLKQSGRAAVESPRTDLWRQDYTGAVATADSSLVLRFVEHGLHCPRSVRNLARDFAHVWEVDVGREVMARESNDVVEGSLTSADHAEKEISQLVGPQCSLPFLLKALTVKSADRRAPGGRRYVCRLI